MAKLEFLQIKETNIVCLVAILMTAAFISIVATFLEYYFPTYSGLSFTNKLHQLPIYIVISLIVWFVVSMIAKVFYWQPILTNKYYYVLGGICGLTPISSIGHLRINELLSFVMILLVALFWGCANAKKNT